MQGSSSASSPVFALPWASEGLETPRRECRDAFGILAQEVVATDVVTANASVAFPVSPVPNSAVVVRRSIAGTTPSLVAGLLLLFPVVGDHVAFSDPSAVDPSVHTERTLDSVADGSVSEVVDGWLQRQSLVVDDWQAPLRNFDEESNSHVFEWWGAGERKLTLYFQGPNDVEYIKVWGPDIQGEMASGRIDSTTPFSELWLWLHSMSN